MLWDPTGGVELAGNAAQAGVDPAMLEAIAAKYVPTGKSLSSPANCS